MKPRGPIVITGFMGCGKSSVARELARRLNMSMLDLDETITERQGRSAARIIIEDGEPAFRAIESGVLRDLLQTKAAAVIALGGGAWIEETNRALIDRYGCTTIWLDAPFEVCWSRIEASEEVRPLGKTKEKAQSLYDHRRAVYQLAGVHFAITAAETFDDLVSRLANQIPPVD